MRSSVVVTTRNTYNIYKRNPDLDVLGFPPTTTRWVVWLCKLKGPRQGPLLSDVHLTLLMYPFPSTLHKVPTGATGRSCKILPCSLDPTLNEFSVGSEQRE